MQNYFNKLPRKLRSKDNKVIPLLVIGFALLGIFSVVSIISESTDIRNLAATIKPGSLTSGCYYVRGQCTGSQTPGATGSCKPVLVCPTDTPTITPTEAVTPTSIPTSIPAPTEIIVPTTSVRLDCARCLSEGASSLCLDLPTKTSSCSNLIESTADQSRVCVPCKTVPPGPNPYKCVFLPACPDTLPCADQKPIEGWCFISPTGGTTNVLFQQ